MLGPWFLALTSLKLQLFWANTNKQTHIKMSFCSYILLVSITRLSSIWYPYLLRTILLLTRKPWAWHLHMSELIFIFWVLLLFPMRYIELQNGIIQLHIITMPLFVFAIFFHFVYTQHFLHHLLYYMLVENSTWSIELCTSPLHTYPYFDEPASVPDWHPAFLWHYMMAGEICSVCRQKVLNHMYCMICDICRFPVHRNCTLFIRTEYNDHMNAGTPDWTCQKCVESAFPFNHIIDDDVFHGCLHEFSCDHTLSASEYVQTKIFNPFNLNDDKDYIPCSDIDPDSCYYNHLSFSIQMNSNYYHEDSFNHSIEKIFHFADTFSMMHLNVRSIPCNLSKLSLYMSNFHINFDIIGLSETWLNDSNKDVYWLDGYNHVSLVRPDRIHGGVSLFISALIFYRILNEISIVNKDIECLFVESESNGVKLYIGIIYRTPDADVRNFCDYLINILEKLKPQNQPCYLMGYYNIDLMKHTSHNPTSEFLDLMFSNSFIPLINKPTRVTSKTATIIDNIFTNEYKNENKYMTGILTTDISDHYPIFHIIQCQHKPHKDQYQLIRLINDSNLDKYINAIQNYEWALVTQQRSCQTAFTYFSDVLTKMFNESFPVIKVKQRYRNKLPWLTEGLKKAIKNKKQIVQDS